MSNTIYIFMAHMYTYLDSDSDHAIHVMSLMMMAIVPLTSAMYLENEELFNR